VTYAPPPPSSAYPSPDANWETLRPDYANVRGFNYAPVYPALFDDPPDLPPHLHYFGSASPVATWRFWQPQDVDRQLGYLKGIGCNAVRVFLSFAVWQHEEQHRQPGGRNGFVARFDELLRLCEKHRMYLMPVLFNPYSPVAQDPGPVPYDDIDQWRREVSHKDVSVAWGRENRYDDYVRAVCTAGRESRAIFLWDLGNEPDPAWVEWTRFLADNVRAADPNPAHGLTVSFAAYPESIENHVYLDPKLDVVSFHPYGVFRQNIAEWVRMARRTASPPHSDRPKPVLATEGGSPGILMPYEDFFGQIRAEGVGFLSWVAVIDDPRGRLPFQYSAGLVYHDGELRDLAGAQAMQTFAREDGVLPFQLAPLREKRDLTGWTGRVFPPGFGVDAAVRELHPLRWPHRPRLGFANFFTDGYGRQRAILEDVSFWGLATLATPRGVPPRGLLTPEEEATLDDYRRTFQRRDLFIGFDPWLTSDDPPEIDWDRYFDFMTEWGLAIWEMVTRHGLES